jgi:ferredoxin-NADP reductase
MYVLLAYVAWGTAGAFLDRISFPWYSIVLSAALLVAVCRASNLAIARFLKIPANSESDVITALILCLILSPADSINDGLILAAAGLTAMASKYVLTINRWHIFNPAALGAFISGVLWNHYASWWVGGKFMFPVILIGGFLILRKMQRFQLVSVFFVISLALFSWNLLGSQSVGAVGHQVWLWLISTPILFFSDVMLIEPRTSPTQRRNYLPFAVLVAFLYGYSRLGVSPEQALLIGNVFAYLIEPQRRYLLTLTGKRSEAESIHSFSFKAQKPPKYLPGQYMEWAISDSQADFRGNRRYFTLSSSPTENEVAVTLKIPSPASTFKQRLAQLKPGETVFAAQVSGTFTLPRHRKQKLALIAGGIGVTPFRSMARHLLDTNRQRPIKLLYAASTPTEFAFTSLFKSAKKLGWETSYLVTGDNIPDWQGLQGQLSVNLLKKVFPDYAERTFYISGPYGFVRHVKNELLKMGIKTKKIVSDYFPGYG